jgi:hypothetical protein
MVDNNPIIEITNKNSIRVTSFDVFIFVNNGRFNIIRK